MTLDQSMSLRDVRDHLSEVVDQVESQHDRITITKHGRRAAVVISVDDLESLEETLEIMSNPELMAEIREGRADAHAGRGEVLTREQALALFTRSE